LVIESHPSPDGKLWSHLTTEQIKEAIAYTSSSSRLRADLAFLVLKLHTLGTRGVLSDFPQLARDFALEKTLAPERSRSQHSKIPDDSKKKIGDVEPFSDEFVQKFIERCVWILENLSEQFLRFYQSYLEISESAAKLGRRQSHPSTTRERKQLLESFDWRDREGNILSKLPWPILVSVGNSPPIATAEWPLSDAVAIRSIMTLIQSVNFTLIAFCTAARPGEILGADSGSLPDKSNYTFSARTFKTANHHDGTKREWPLHKIAVKALEIQLKLSKLFSSGDSKQIWITFIGGAKPAGSELRNVTEQLVNTTAILGLSELTGDRRAHANRWRHTMARLIALSVTSAPRVLMDLLGHREIETTLHYMLSSSQISQEVIKIAGELSAVHAKEVIEDALAGEAGGPAAALIKAGLDEFTMVRGEDELQAESLQDAIDILTFNGRFWQLVRPGVVCTKTIGQFGPCTKGRGEPDPGACRSTCDHRVETSRAKQQCHDTIEALLRELTHAAREGLDMLVANLQGQILANLHRWSEIRDHFLRESAEIRSIWAARSSQNSAA
jgi:integrase